MRKIVKFVWIIIMLGLIGIFLVANIFINDVFAYENKAIIEKMNVYDSRKNELKSQAKGLLTAQKSLLIQLDLEEEIAMKQQMQVKKDIQEITDLQKELKEKQLIAKNNAVQKADTNQSTVKKKRIAVIKSTPASTQTPVLETAPVTTPKRRTRAS